MFQTHSLVLYKTRPARVLAIGDKIEIELQGGKTKRVRAKDVALLHPGPAGSLADLNSRSGEHLEAWELLADGETQLIELSELVFGEYTPASAWATWELVADGLYFQGTPELIEVRSPEQVARERRQREAKQAAEQAWSGFLKRMETGALLDEDRSRLSEVELLALRKREKSRILQELGVQQQPEAAHRLLVKVGYWVPTHNPYPGRLGVKTDIPQMRLPSLQDEQRKDLRHLAAYAIDDEGSQDPDDAISFDGERIWVHIADVSALVPAESEADLEARVRGANLYLPEGVVPMLPLAATQQLGLGLDETSPALSVAFRITAEGTVDDIEVVPSWVRVSRLSYSASDKCMEQQPFRQLAEMTQRYRERRAACGSTSLELPEVSVRVMEGEVAIRPLPRTASRNLVTDAMLAAGEAVGRYAIEHAIPLPFVAQAPPDSVQQPIDMAAMFAYRRRFKPSRLTVQPEPHAGLGLEVYTRVTSPLRRYSDLLVHQQLRAWLHGKALLSEQEIGDRVSVAALGSANIRKVERISNRHWTLVYLQQHPDWKGEGGLVEIDGQKGTVLLPELGFEAKIRLRKQESLNVSKRLMVREVDLVEQTAYFQVQS